VLSYDPFLIPKITVVQTLGLATADIVHGNRETSLHFVAYWMLVLPKLGRSLR